MPTTPSERAKLFGGKPKRQASYGPGRMMVETIRTIPGPRTSGYTPEESFKRDRAESERDAHEQAVRANPQLRDATTGGPQNESQTPVVGRTSAGPDKGTALKSRRARNFGGPSKY